MRKYQEERQKLLAVSIENTYKLFFYFLTKKLHIFVAFGDYNFFIIGIALRTEMLFA